MYVFSFVPTEATVAFVYTYIRGHCSGPFNLYFKVDLRPFQRVKSKQATNQRLSLGEIYQISQVLKIHVLSKEFTLSL